jgi:hypothetical protein
LPRSFAPFRGTRRTGSPLPCSRRVQPEARGAGGSIWVIKSVLVTGPESPLEEQESPERPQEPEEPDERERQAQACTTYTSSHRPHAHTGKEPLIVTAEPNARNQRQALVVAGLVAWAAGLLVWLSPSLWFLLGLSPCSYWWVRRRCFRRVAVIEQPFPAQREQILRAHVAFFEALDKVGKARFRQLVPIFLDEVRITGIRTEVDETIRVVVAASAAIPIFGFLDWDYHRLREVLSYPDAFDDAYQRHGGSEEAILGMVGLHHLSGVMILF